MMRKRLLAALMPLVVLAASAWGDAIQDPKAAVEADNFSTPLSQFTGAFDPTSNGGVLALYNDTGAIVTSLSLDATIAKGLAPADIGSSFSCNSGPDNPYFLFCGFDYNTTTGALGIDFFGVNPPDGDELNGTSDEVGEQEGIPAVSAACLLAPEVDGCNGIGHFAFVFNNDLSVVGSGDTGWVPTETSVANPNTPLFDGPPTITVSYSTSAPEPRSLLLLGGAVLALAGLSRRRVSGR